MATGDYKYKGILAKREPLKITGKSDAEKGAQLQTWLMPRMKALFDDCGVPKKSGWSQVGLVLAQRHVPAFQEARPRTGRPRADVLGDLEVVRAVHARVGRNMSILSAASQVAANRKRGETKEAIAERYRRVLKGLKGLTPEQRAWVLGTEQK